MSNSEAIAIAFQRIPCMLDYTRFDSLKRPRDSQDTTRQN